MDWRLERSNGDTAGLEGLMAQAQREVGDEPLRGSRFLHDAQEMLRATREIEAAVSGQDTELWVGFQKADKLDGERDVYVDLVEGGTTVLAFGEGSPQLAGELEGLAWTELEPEPSALENQWFLITKHPEPVAFVGYETSPDHIRTTGGALDAAKSWEGFVTSDERLIDLLLSHLDKVRSARG